MAELHFVFVYEIILNMNLNLEIIVNYVFIANGYLPCIVHASYVSD